MQLFTEADVDAGALRGEKIAVLGYGSQGRAHAMSGTARSSIAVTTSSPPGPAWW
jgi:ketol-acid reductoisomerase